MLTQLTGMGKRPTGAVHFLEVVLPPILIPQRPFDGKLRQVRMSRTTG